MMNLRFEEIKGYQNSATKNFETMCALLVIREIPSAKAIEGKGGDEGIDTLVGTIGNAGRIFQAKYFCNTLKPPQKRQIEESLTVALQKHKPQKWTLCIPKDLTISEERWFEGLKKSHPQCSMDYWNATTLISKLLENPDIRYTFFPSATDLTDFDLISQSFLGSLRADLKNETSFFDGTRPTWSDIVLNKDIRRDLTDIVLPVLLQDAHGMQLLELTATGGSGKSTFLMRLAYELCVSHQTVLFHRRDKNYLDAQSVLKFVNLLRVRRVYIIVDDAVRISNFDEFLSYLSDFSPNITLITASRTFERRAKQTNTLANLKYLRFPENAVQSLGSLSDSEILALINKLATHEKVRRPEEHEISEVVFDHKGR